MTTEERDERFEKLKANGWTQLGSWGTIDCLDIAFVKGDVLMIDRADGSISYEERPKGITAAESILILT
jgi:hypothetical protein